MHKALLPDTGEWVLLWYELSKKSWGLTLLADRNQLDLLDQSEVEKFLSAEKPDSIINAAARVGGVYANSTIQPNSSIKIWFSIRT